MFSWGIEKEKWHEMGSLTVYNISQRPDISVKL